MTPNPATEPAATHNAAAGCLVYVYYKVAEADAQAHERAALAFQAELLKHHKALWPQLSARLMRRPEAIQGQHTWMEVYELGQAADPDRLPIWTEIEQQAQAALGSRIQGTRHCEVFVPVHAEANVGLRGPRLGQ